MAKVIFANFAASRLCNDCRRFSPRAGVHCFLLGTLQKRRHHRFNSTHSGEL